MRPAERQRLTLAILSVLAGWSLLGVLAGGLLLILKPLESIRGSLRKITMGVRAIEQETAPLGPGADTLIAGLGQTGGGLSGIAQRLDAVVADLDHLAPRLRGR
jgi:hypothetical protein